MKRFAHLLPILELQLAMICISTSGAIGRAVDLPPPLTIWGRAVFALCFLGLYCWWRGFRFRFDVNKNGWTIGLTGVLMALHWVTYFYALQWSNVAVGMLSLFTYPIMTAFLEPLFLKTKFEIRHFLLGALVLFGLYFLVPELDLQNHMTQGLGMGLLSALVYSLRNIILKTKVTNFNGSMLMFYQMVIAVILLAPVLLIYEPSHLPSQLPFLVFLGLVTTAIGHTLFLNSFQHFSVSTASILSSIQPVYGILIAMIFLTEFPTGRSMIGGGLILLTVILESWQVRK